MTTYDEVQHAEAWLLLPWLANGRLTGSERSRVEEHVRSCPACAGEVSAQRLLGAALTAPERVSYAPGPSFRKLLERIDGGEQAVERQARVAPTRSTVLRHAWRPPGLAWAASFLLTLLLGAAAMTAWQWTQPRFVTYTGAASATPGVLHIAFERAVTIGEAEDALHAAGARIVNGPDGSGIFGVAPLEARGGALQALETRLRADTRVRWVEPLPGP
jgi:hypothetical protein